VVRGYVLIQTRVGMGPRVALDIVLIEGVISSEFVTGPYDVIASAQAATLDDLGRLVAAEIHAVDGVTRTITCLSARSV
jgi:DNA-binding Lrp family transcriptional regulator